MTSPGMSGGHEISRHGAEPNPMLLLITITSMPIT
jgi:hypothetical protein